MKSKEFNSTTYLFEHKYIKGRLAGKSDKLYIVMVEAKLQRVLAEMKFGSNFTFHGFRHSCATHLLKVTNGDIARVQKHLRHEKGSSVTLRYLHIMDKGFSSKELAGLG